MIPTAVVFAYLAAALYIGIFAFRSSRGGAIAEDYFLAGRSLGPAVFLLSLFGANMTAFSILGASGHAFANGIVTFGLMASSSALIIPLALFVFGTRLWALGRRNGFITPVQMFRDRWECAHIGTLIFVVQAVLLVPYIIIAVMGGGTTLAAVSGGLVPYWLGGAIVSLVVMGYVFFGGMRGTAWVNTFQTTLFLLFGTIAVVVIGGGMGGFSARDGVAARVAGDGAAAQPRAGVDAVFLQLHVHPALVDHVPAHRHLLPDGEAPRPLQEDRHPVSDLHAAHLAAVGVSRRGRQRGAGTCRRSQSKLDARSTLANAGPAPARSTERDRLRARRGWRRRHSAAGRRVRAALARRAARRRRSWRR